MSTAAKLSEREKQVVNGLCAGKLLKEIAFGLGIAESTVKVYLSRVRARLGANTNCQIVAVICRKSCKPLSN